MLSVTVVTLALNPTSLIALAFLAMAWVYLFVVRQAPIVIGGRTFRSAKHLFETPPACPIADVTPEWGCPAALGSLGRA